MIRDVLRIYCFGPSATLASIVFGAALAAMYHVWGRYDDATQLRYGGDSMVWHRNGPADSHWVDLYVNKHKNRQDGGTHHAIAASEGPSLGAFEALSLAFSRLHEIGVRAGFLLPGRLYLLDVPAQRSRAQWETHMTLHTFTGLLRNALLCIGMPSDEVFLITSHGIRAGVNTDSASGPDRLSPQEIALEASVNNDGDAWSLGYMRRDASHLVTTSRRVGSTTTILT